MDDLNYKVDDIINSLSQPISKVIGIDKYSITTFSSKKLKYLSYTLVSIDDPDYRWWLVNLPIYGLYTYTKHNKVDQGLSVLEDLSGYVELESIGNADFSTDSGALITYTDSNNSFYAKEIFNDSSLLIFKGVNFESE